MLEDEGIDMLTVHARLKDEPFARRPRWEWIAKLKEWLHDTGYRQWRHFSLCRMRKIACASQMPTV